MFHSLNKDLGNAVAGLPGTKKTVFAMELIAEQMKRGHIAWRSLGEINQLPEQAQASWKIGPGSVHLIQSEDRVGTMVGPALNAAVITTSTFKQWDQVLQAMVAFVSKIPQMYMSSPSLWRLFMEANYNAKWLESPHWSGGTLPFLVTRLDAVVGRTSKRLVPFEANQGNRGQGWINYRRQDYARLLWEHTGLALPEQADMTAFYKNALLGTLSGVAKLRKVKRYDPTANKLWLVARPEDKVASDVIALGEMLSSAVTGFEMIDPMNIVLNSDGSAIDASSGQVIHSALRMYTHPYADLPLDQAARAGKAVVIGESGYKVQSDKLMLALLASCKGVQAYVKRFVAPEQIDLLVSHLNAEIDPQMQVVRIRGSQAECLIDMDPDKGSAQWKLVEPKDVPPDIVLKTAMDSGTHGVHMRNGKPEQMYAEMMAFAAEQGKPVILMGRRTSAVVFNVMNAYGYMPGQTSYPAVSEGVPRVELFGVADFSDPCNPTAQLTFTSAQVSTTANLVLIHGSTTNTWMMIYQAE